MSDKAEKVKQPKKEKKPPPAEPPDMLQPRQLIAAHSGKQYLVEQRLGKGGFGEVYQVSLNKHRDKKFAMKVEPNAMDGKSNTMLRLKVEIYVFEQMAQCKTFDHTHFVKMHDKGITTTFKYYVMDVIWASLKEICQKTLENKPLSPHTVMHIARQTLKSIRQLHQLGFLHRDIKWHNFAVGLPPKDSTIFMLDFGIARPYREKNGNVRVAREKVPFLGTVKYASVRSMNSEDQGRRDDLESWLYMMMELYNPANLKFFMNHQTLPEIRKHKQILMENPQRLYNAGILKVPLIYVRIIGWIDELKYADEPMYTTIDTLLGAYAVAEKINMDLPLDWKGKWEVEEKKMKDEEAAKKKDEKRDESRKDEVEPISGDKESKKKDRKKERRKESRKKRKKRSRNKDEETLITMEEMLDELKEEKKRRLKNKKAGKTMEDDEEDYWKSDEENSEDDISGDEDDYRRKRKKKKSRKRRSKERTRDYSDRENDDYETCPPPDDRDYDKTPIRRRRQKRTSGGRKKSTSKMSKVSRKTYEEDQDKNTSKMGKVSKNAFEEDQDKNTSKMGKVSKKMYEEDQDKNASKICKVSKKAFEEDQEKSVVGIPEKVSKLTNPEPDDGAYMMLGDANAMEKAQDKKDKDKNKKDGDKKEEKSAPPSGSAEPVKKASEAAPDKKEPVDAKKK